MNKVLSDLLNNSTCALHRAEFADGSQLIRVLRPNHERSGVDEIARVTSDEAACAVLRLNQRAPR